MPGYLKKAIPSGVILIIDIIIILLIPSQVKVYMEGIVNTRFLPYLVTILILICGLADIFKIVMKGKKETAEVQPADTKKSGGKAGYLRVLGAVAAMGVWLWIVPSAGFVVSTVLLSAAIMLLAGNKSWIQIVLLSVILTMVVYCLFKLALNLRLPQGIFFF